MYTGNRVTRRAPVDFFGNIDRDQGAIKDNPVSTAILATLQAIDGGLDSLPFDCWNTMTCHQSVLISALARRYSPGLL